jgi:hypothetical protein
MKTLVADSRTRVSRNTSRGSQARIRRATRKKVHVHARSRTALDRRLLELDREWDVERTIEANASTLALAGTLLGTFVNRWFLVLPAAVAAFLLQHAIQGWCPPIPLLRRLGYRTTDEIWEERVALKTARGDFGAAKGLRRSPLRALEAARR